MNKELLTYIKEFRLEKKVPVDVFFTKTNEPIQRSVTQILDVENGTEQGITINHYNVKNVSVTTSLRPMSKMYDVYESIKK